MFHDLLGNTARRLHAAIVDDFADLIKVRLSQLYFLLDFWCSPAAPVSQKSI